MNTSLTSLCERRNTEDGDKEENGYGKSIETNVDGDVNMFKRL